MPHSRSSNFRGPQGRCLRKSLSYTFPAVKNPDKEAGPEWATKDIAGELTVYGPEPVADVYIVYHKKTPTPTPTPAPKTNPAGTGDAAPLGPLAALALAGVAGIGLALGMRRRNAQYGRHVRK